ncbi:phage tail protein [Sinorhizobium fredii]|uniref:phage tail protein n=1 Tax=Rhizobium fredii TaxID=380 RepID=UPI0030B25CFA
MAQHDQVIDNGPGLAVRTDFNAALAALFSSSSGAVEPAMKVAGQLWFNTTTGKLQLRNSANTAWQGLTDSMSGIITLAPPVTFTAATPDVGTEVLKIRDTRTTTGAVGNAQFSINRQNSDTEALILGNDGNGAALIGGNNVALRFGNWVAGAFTERLSMTGAGLFTFAGTHQVIIGGTHGIEIVGATPNIKMTDNTASAYDFWMHADSQNWYVLVDRTGDGAWDTPHPLTLEADTNKAYVFGSEIATTTSLGSYVPQTTQVVAGNGLITGGALSANVTLNMGTPGTLSATSTNAVQADSHTHDVNLIGTTWSDQAANRVAGTSYQNTTGLYIMVSIVGSDGTQFQISSNNSTWLLMQGADTDQDGGSSITQGILIPPNWYYKTTGGFTQWKELR